MTYTSVSAVYVRWYGRVLQGTVVPNATPSDSLFGSMVAVTIPIQGTTATALFNPAHVYESAELASEKPAAVPPPPSFVHSPGCEPGPPSQAALEAHRRRYRDFKAAHWDHEHNHLQVGFLEQGYQLFRQGIAMKMQLSKLQSNKDTPPNPPTPKKKATPIQLSLFD